MTKPSLIALTGLSRCGKDSYARAFVEQGWVGLALGDIIKLHFDPDVQRLLGFSAFTENDAEKALIRPLLVHGGLVFYDHFLAQYLAVVQRHLRLGHRIINTRLFDVREARAWTAMGGVIWEVIRPGTVPAEPVEAEQLALMRGEGLIEMDIYNHGDLAAWQERAALHVEALLRISAQP